MKFAPIPMKRCKRCDIEYDEEVFFRRKNDARRLHISSRTHDVCIRCEQTARDVEKSRDRWASKARDSIRRHAAKYEIDVGTFVDRFGWETEVVRHGFEHAYTNGCPYCHRPYAGMGHGLYDITIDICDPRSAPHFETNTKFCCQTCNREKGTMPPDLWARKLRCWAIAERADLERLKRETFGLPLFDLVCAA